MFSVNKCLDVLHISSVSGILHCKFGTCLNRCVKDGARPGDQLICALYLAPVSWGAVNNSCHLSTAASTYDWRSPISRGIGPGEPAN